MLGIPEEANIRAEIPKNKTAAILSIILLDSMPSLPDYAALGASAMLWHVFVVGEAVVAIVCHISHLFLEVPNDCSKVRAYFMTHSMKRP